MMNTATTTPPEDATYDGDFHAWSEQQAARLRARLRWGTHDGIDHENVAEEIESLGRSDRRAIKSCLRVILTHLLKWRHQPGGRTDSWTESIFNARTAIADLIEESPSLVRFATETIARAFPLAVRDAVSQTKLHPGNFPTACPFTAGQVFDIEFLPPDIAGAAPAP